MVPKVDRYSQELYDLTHYLREKGVPIIFWNKEDPVYTDIFMLAAGYADVVFTTDIDCIPRYKAELGHDRVYHLHFAAQPQLHNPIEKYDRKDKFCFAGAYYHKYKERCRVFDDFAAQFIAGKGLDIYDRNYGHARPSTPSRSSTSPTSWALCPPARSTWPIKGYTYGINMNSIQQSQTMFARRAFEMMASNTITVGNFSRGMKNYFGDLTICTNDAKTVELYLEHYCQDPATRDKYRLLGLRKALSEGLYQDRLGYITEKVFGVNMKPKLPAVTVLARAGSKKQAERLARLFQAQTLPGARLVFVGTGLRGKEDAAPCVQSGDLASTRCGDVCGEGLVAVWEGTDWYGPNYLLDLALTWNYGAFRGAGKSGPLYGGLGPPHPGRHGLPSGPVSGAAAVHGPLGRGAGYDPGGAVRQYGGHRAGADGRRPLPVLPGLEGGVLPQGGGSEGGGPGSAPVQDPGLRRGHSPFRIRGRTFCASQGSSCPRASPRPRFRLPTNPTARTWSSRVSCRRTSTSTSTIRRSPLR